ncbi:hypothetical protein Lal_00046348 [Lupinus albus]|uniref:Putative expansin/Lol pI n=1 Tax=Lupinus albus TaxID=3870 RepID=A0A6A4PEK3_LUPAL|nr:putative expansin/Lol pI [Lupinus albus]KAF1887110.1 hypothetical protein Lal_00046348 [Lupinus albus]
MQRHRVFVAFFSLCFCSSLRLMLVCAKDEEPLDKGWYRGTATWYGEPEGSGSTGGACGYGPMVNEKPFMYRVSAAGPKLYKKGKGCGACYKVKCRDKEMCAKRAVTVIITDECPGCPPVHFDLSGAAFGRMAVEGKNGHLRNKGRLPIIFKRVSCQYPGKEISFHVNDGSSPHFLSVLVKFVRGDGEISSMYLQQGGSKEWMPMTNLWGANWAITKGPLKGPYSLRIITNTGKSFTSKNVIPNNFSPKTTYTASKRAPK